MQTVFPPVTQNSLLTLKKSVRSRLIIAIDGPAGAGKSTVAMALAKKLELHYMDTGAMYRALALKVQTLGIGTKDAQRLAESCSQSRIEFGDGDPQPIFLDGKDVSDQIRTLEIGELASALSVHPEVRKQLVALQQKILENGGATLEGRDATTVIAPGAPIKIFLTASLEERTRRRFSELKTKGLQVTYAEVKAQIAERDQRDTTRKASPLRIAEDATVIDSQQMNVDEVVEQILNLMHQWIKTIELES